MNCTPTKQNVCSREREREREKRERESIREREYAVDAVDGAAQEAVSEAGGKGKYPLNLCYIPPT